MTPIFYIVKRSTNNILPPTCKRSMVFASKKCPPITTSTNGSTHKLFSLWN